MLSSLVWSFVAWDAEFPDGTISAVATGVDLSYVYFVNYFCSLIFMNLGTGMLWEGQGLVGDVLLRKTMPMLQTLLPKERKRVLVHPSHQCLLVHQDDSNETWHSSNGQQEGTGSQGHDVSMSMVVASTKIRLDLRIQFIICTQVREQKATVQASKRKAYIPVRLHILPSSEPFMVRVHLLMTLLAIHLCLSFLAFIVCL